MKQQDFGFSGRQIGWLRMIIIGIALSASLWTPGSQGGARVALAQATPVTTTCRVTVDKLRLREGPGVAFRAITLLSINTRLLASEVTSNLQWIKVRVASADQTGWVSVRSQTQTYVRCNLAVTRLPRSQSVRAPPQRQPHIHPAWLSLTHRPAHQRQHQRPTILAIPPFQTMPRAPVGALSAKFGCLVRYW